MVFVLLGKLLQARDEIRMSRRERDGVLAVVLREGSFLFAPFAEATCCHSSLIRRTDSKTNTHLFQFRAVQNIPRG